MIYRLIHADVMDGLAQLADASAQCVVTSPPYWGLRDYSISPSTWGGDASHAHEWGDMLRRTGGGRGQGSSSIRLGRANVRAQELVREQGSACECGAWRGCFGLEPTPELYVEHAVLIFREVRRVLRDDGTLWLNMGDSYTDSGRGTDVGSTLQGTRQNQQESRKTRVREATRTGLPPKNLLGMPWRLAFALQADGWYLRSEIIWHKPNPMPESVTDRPTKAHEQIFLLSKRAKYFYDGDAIKEPASFPNGPNAPDAIASPYGQGFARRALGPKGQAADPTENLSAHGAKMGRGDGWRNDPLSQRSARNKRSVWTVATAPFPEAHFATFPPDLIEPCILAGSRVGDVVLDPFNGSGTTGIVALSHQRDYVGIELNGEYVAMSERRLAAVAPMFAKPYAPAVT